MARGKAARRIWNTFAGIAVENWLDAVATGRKLVKPPVALWRAARRKASFGKTEATVKLKNGKGVVYLQGARILVNIGGGIPNQEVTVKFKPENLWVIGAGGKTIAKIPHGAHAYIPRE